MKIFIKGLNSCVMRKHKLRQYHDYFEANGVALVDSPESSDINLIWTCAFRDDVKNNSLSEIKRYQKEYDAQVAVAGCLPDIDREELDKLHSDFVLPWKGDEENIKALVPQESVALNQIPETFAEPKVCNNTEQFRKDNPSIDVTFHDQFVKVTVCEGCLYNCSYCSEKLMFPAFTSFSEDELIKEFTSLLEKTGQTQVILMADSLGNYGQDVDSSLHQLIQRFLEVDPRVKVALNNLHPASFILYKEELFSFIKQGSILHINLPIQTASTPLLKRMGRPYTKNQLERIFAGFEALNFKFFDTHILVGFPGETDEDIEETIQFLLKYKVRHVLVSAYMETANMPSASFPDKISPQIIQQRVERVCQKAKEAGIIFNADFSQRANALNCV